MILEWEFATRPILIGKTSQDMQNFISGSIKGSYLALWLKHSYIRDSFINYSSIDIIDQTHNPPKFDDFLGCVKISNNLQSLLTF